MSQERETIAKNKQMGLHLSKKFSHSKEIVEKTASLLNGRQYLPIFNKGSISKIRRELIQRNIQTAQFKNEQGTGADIYPRGTYRWPTGM